MKEVESIGGYATETKYVIRIRTNRDPVLSYILSLLFDTEEQARAFARSIPVRHKEDGNDKMSAFYDACEYCIIPVVVAGSRSGSEVAKC